MLHILGLKAMGVSASEMAILQNTNLFIHRKLKQAIGAYSGVPIFNT